MVRKVRLIEETALKQGIKNLRDRLGKPDPVAMLNVFSVQEEIRPCHCC